MDKHQGSEEPCHTSGAITEHRLVWRLVRVPLVFAVSSSQTTQGNQGTEKLSSSPATHSKSVWS